MWRAGAPWRDSSDNHPTAQCSTKREALHFRSAFLSQWSSVCGCYPPPAAAPEVSTHQEKFQYSGGTAHMAPLTFRRLQLWNLGVGVAQLVAGIAILILGSPFSNPATQLPWYSNFVGSWSRDNGNAEQFYV